MNPAAAADRRTASHVHTSTRTTVSVLGALAALTGVEHGIGEITQGWAPAPSLVFGSWSHVDAFDALGGEPAMSLVPSLLASGVLSVVVALTLGAWATRYVDRPHAGAILAGLSVLLLVVGGGFGPPLLGILIGLLATRLDAPRVDRRGPATRLGTRLWPWSLATAVVCFLGLVPGTIVLNLVTGVDNPALVAVLIAGAFAGTALAMWSARVRDQVSDGPVTTAGASSPRHSSSEEQGGSS